MKMDLEIIHSIARDSSLEVFDQTIRSLVSGKPITSEIPGVLVIDIDILKDRKLFPEMFAKYNEVVSYFDKKFYKEKSWLECYDKLVRIDGCNEESILYVVKYFRREGQWWRDTGNFNTLLKLRKLNNEKIKYIDFFKEKIKADYSSGKKGFATGNIIHKKDGKQREY